MKKYKKYFICVILLGTLLLSVLLEEYQMVEEQLNLEMNRLYSNNSKVIESLSSINNNNELQQYSFRVFGEFQEDPFVRSYYSNDYTSWKPLLKEGRFFDKADTREAVVGKNVKLEEEKNEKYYLYNGKKYKVIGYWGIVKSSFMDDQILLNDSSYFTDKNIKTVLGTKNIQIFEENNVKFLDVPIKDIWNPINDQFFTEWIIKLSNWLSILVFILSGIIISLGFKKETEIKYLIGVTKYKIWLKQLWFVSSVFFLIFITSIGITYIIMPELINIDILLKNISYYFILLISFIVTELYLNLRRQKCGN
ncbi:hypothetical protein [Aminipila sp.]|uniref:hypothetical protein n=1 Tax=Aminipila sp. TaxID=2060095 RepID=UPI00289BE666|nr:hypothetical protein [Aminipila sp.]